MSVLSRRRFFQDIGRGGAGALAGSWVAFRGHEALAGLPSEARVQALKGGDRGLIRLDSNENPLGPSAVALEAVRANFGEAGRYPDNPAVELTDALAKLHGVTDVNIVLGSGSGEVLRMAVYAFTSATRPLVQGLPTFEEAGRYAEIIGTPVVSVPVDARRRLDLDGMAAKATGAGLIFFCNPNNPTGTVHGAAAVSDFIGRVLKSSPETVVLVDEAYHHYVEAPSYASAVPLALEDPRVVVCRTFSKAYGMAGLRVGYAVGHAETIARLRRQKLSNNVNQLGAAAAIAALGDPEAIERERTRNRQVREMTRRALADMGFASDESHTNFIMVDIRRDAKQFQAACRKLGVAVGRPFPPLTQMARISIGTEDEMRQAIAVFRKVLLAAATVA